MTTEPGDLELAGRALAVQPNVLPGELEVAVKRANDFAKAEKALNTVVACHQGVEHRARLSRG
jgi:hypothetical protein